MCVEVEEEETEEDDWDDDTESDACFCARGKIFAVYLVLRRGVGLPSKVVTDMVEERGGRDGGC